MPNVQMPIQEPLPNMPIMPNVQMPIQEPLPNMPIMPNVQMPIQEPLPNTMMPPKPNVQMPIQETKPNTMMPPKPNVQMPIQEPLPNMPIMPPMQPVMPYMMPPVPIPDVEHKKTKEEKCESTSSYWHGESSMMPYSYPGVPHDMQGGYPFATANIMNPYTYSPGMSGMQPVNPYHATPPYGLPYAPYCHPHMPAVQPMYKDSCGCHESSFASDSSHC